MPKYWHDSLRTIHCRKINITDLLRRGSIQKGIKVISTLNWTSGLTINLICDWSQDLPTLSLSYKLPNGKEIDYIIRFGTIDSNLGIGKILYFLCPKTQKRCKILYLAYGYSYFRSREAYLPDIIYYNTQNSSKIFYPAGRHFTIEDQIEKIEKRKYRRTYKGKPTKIALRVERLWKAYFEFGRQRDEVLAAWGKKNKGVY